MLESAAEQLGGKEEQEIKNICLVSHFPKAAFRIQIQEGKNDPQKLKKVKKFHVMMCQCRVHSLLKAEGFSCSLDVLDEGLGISNCNYILFFFLL
jgi:hypothetical protein